MRISLNNQQPTVSPPSVDSELLEFMIVADDTMRPSYKYTYMHKMSDGSADVYSSDVAVSSNHTTVIDSARQAGFAVVEKRQKQIMLGLLDKLNRIQDLRINGQLFTEILGFENISLWQFVPESCYPMTAAGVQHIIELIEYLSELIERFNPQRISVTGPLEDYQRKVLGLIAQRYEKIIDCCPVPVRSRPASNGGTSGGDVHPDHVRLEEGQPFAVRNYVESIRRDIPLSLQRDKALLISSPRVWSRTVDGTEIDQYYHAFKPFFVERGLQPIRLEVPHYFQIKNSKKEYIDSVVTNAKDDFETLFLDEFYANEFYDLARQLQGVLQQRFDRYARDPAFLKSFDWKGISFFTPLIDFWQNLFVSYLAYHCIPAILTARKMLAELKPKVVFAIYETGLFARAVIIEAQRAGVPTIGLEHGMIFPEHPYYLHKYVSNRPDLTRFFQGFVVPTRTIVYGSYQQDVLTKRGSYPEDSTFVLGGDWRLLNQPHTQTGGSELVTLKNSWFTESKKVALVLSQPILTAGIVRRLIQKLDPIQYAILIKLHPDDKGQQAYVDAFTQAGFEVKVTGDYLVESIEMADFISSPLLTTVVLDCLLAQKSVCCYRTTDFGYTIPWADFVFDIDQVDQCDKLEWSPEMKRGIKDFLERVGYDGAMTADDFKQRMHRVFDEIVEKTSGGHQDMSRIAPVALKVDSSISQPLGVFKNDLYKQLDVNYDNFFHDIWQGKHLSESLPMIQRVRRISFQLSNLCNYSQCHKRCPLSRETEKIILPGRIVRRTIDEMSMIDFDGVFAFHMYNEPLIDPRLFEFIRYAGSRCPRSKVLILTNGWYLNQTMADELAELCIWNLVVSAYSDSEFKRLAALKVKVPYSVFRATLDERQDMYEREAVDIHRPCFAPVADVSIAPTGHVVLCCLDFKSLHKFGDLNCETLDSILNSPETVEVYSDLIQSRRRLHLCRRCSWVR